MGCARPPTTPADAPNPSAAERERLIAQFRAPCDPAVLRHLVGRPFGTELETEARRLSGRKTVRTIRPGEPVSADYRTDRLNIDIDARGHVVRFTCS